MLGCNPDFSSCSRNASFMSDQPTADFPDVCDKDRLRLRRFLYVLIIAVAAGSSFSDLMRSNPLMSANDRSRWSTVWSLVDRGTYQIDEIQSRKAWSSIDKVYYEGHFYSTKPPLLPTMAAGLYWTVKQVTGWYFLSQPEAVGRTILLFVNWLPAVLSLVVISLLVERYARKDQTRYLVLVTAAAGTLATPFLNVFNNHTIAVACVVFSLYPLMRILIDGEKSASYFLIAGFTGAFATCNELPSALYGLALFGLLLKKNPANTMKYFVPAALVPLLGFFYTNYLVTGGWKPFYMYYGTELYNYTVDGIPSYWSAPKGIDRGIETPWVYFLNLTVGHHGIYSLSPIFLLSVFGWLTMRSNGRPELKTFLRLGCVLTVVILAFYLSRTSNYSYGGKTNGLRWSLWLVPFWLVAMIPAVDRMIERCWFQILAAVLLFISVFSAGYSLNNPWQHSWIFTLMEKQGWLDYDEKPPALPRKLVTWFPNLPNENRDQSSPYWVEFEGAGLGGKKTKLRIEAIDELADKNLQKIRVTKTLSSGDVETHDLIINRKAFNVGSYPWDFLNWKDTSQPSEEKSKIYHFLLGLPKSKNYRPGFIRYLKTDLRDDAFRCQRSAAEVIYDNRGKDQPYRYRSDLWLSDEIPFGTAQIEQSVISVKTGEVLMKQRLTVIATSGLLQGASH